MPVHLPSSRYAPLCDTPALAPTHTPTHAYPHPLALVSTTQLPTPSICVRLHTNVASPPYPPYPLFSRDVLQPLPYFCIAQLRVPHDGAPGLDGLDHLGRHIARQRKPGAIGVQLHCPPQSLLSACGHAARGVWGGAVSFVESVALLKYCTCWSTRRAGVLHVLGYSTC